ncbi:8-oxoguanine glycosylase ogg1 [Kappamyces sp. JEL0829]|nr:8-oxoguanine glycosylase ogg1 [Kappamyces sp. JEL0829]
MPGVKTEDEQWHPLTTNPRELSLEKTLYCGQAFRWKKVTGVDGQVVYTSTIDRVWVSLRQALNEGVWFRLHSLEPDVETVRLLLHDYFQLHVSLEDLWSAWCLDSNFKKRSGGLEGLRVLRQPPIENIFSFICSANNNVSRISQMIDKMCRKYGSRLGFLPNHIDGLEDKVEVFAFPTLQELHGNAIEQELRALGFGYRAKYIAQSVQMLLAKPADYLDGLRSMSYEECRDELLKLAGVGPKVADCIALFSMDKCGVVPVDTHVWAIAERDYNVKIKTLNAKTYAAVGESFRKALGSHAGWAHSVLFAAEAGLGSSKARTGIPDVRSSAPPAKKRRKIKAESGSE